jgi:hypothetical protein
LLNGDSFAATQRRFVAIDAVLVPPNANCRPGFEMQLLQNVLDVFLHSARTALENRSDLAISFSGSDPFRDFELAFGQRVRLGKSASFRACFGGSAVPGGHGKIAFSGTQSLRLYA